MRFESGRYRWATRRIGLLPAVGLALAPSAAFPADRVALVVGNGAYAAIGALPNPSNDATDVAAALGRLGFDVTTVRDADRAGMSEALRVFTRESAGADVSLVFYAGHGLEMDGVNYLVPVDAQLERDTDVRFEAVELDDVLAATTGAGLRIVILDACRNNPLARSMQRTGASRNVSRGSFGELDENLLGDETLVAYAAAAGTTAADGTGRNSPYTTALLEYLEQPLEIGILFREVRGRVLEETGGEQRPHEYASLLDEHYLRGASGPGTVAIASGAPTEALLQQENLFWQSISDSANRADFQAYLDQFPRGAFVRLARNRIAALGAEAVGEVSSPPAAADEARPAVDGPRLLSFGRQSRGRIDRRGDTAVWAFLGDAGQRISVAVTSGDFDTTVALVSPTGARVGYDDDGGVGLNSLLYSVLPTAGRYLVNVTPYGDNDDGAYRIALRSGFTMVYVSNLESDDALKFQRRNSCVRARVRVVGSRDEADYVLEFGRESNDGAVLRDPQGGRVRSFNGTMRQNSLFDDVCESGYLQ